MATKINDVTFETYTVVSGFEVHGLVFADRQWDAADDELHVNHVFIKAHNCGSEFAKSFGDDELRVAESFTVCNIEVDFNIRGFESPDDVEDLVIDFMRCFLLGRAPFAMEYGWFRNSIRKKFDPSPFVKKD